MEGIVHTINIPADAHQTLGPAHFAVMPHIKAKWEAAMFWCAYLAYPCIDIHRRPYLSQNIKANRNWGEFCHRWKGLVRVCWEIDARLSKKFPQDTPFTLWLKCMKEFVVRDFEEARAHSSTPKTIEITFLESFLKGLEDNRQTYTPRSLAINAVLKIAQKLRRKPLKPHQSDDLKEVWAPLLIKLKGHIRAISKMVWVSVDPDGELVYQHQGKKRIPQRFTFEDIPEPEPGWIRIPIKIGTRDGVDCYIFWDTRIDSMWSKSWVCAFMGIKKHNELPMSATPLSV